MALYKFDYFLTSVSIPEGGLKIDENDWKGMMLSPCSQEPAITLCYTPTHASNMSPQIIHILCLLW